MSDYSKIIASLSPEKRALLELRLKKQSGNYNLFPMSFAQQRLWFLELLEPGNSIYNIPSAVRLTGELHIDSLSKSINEIVKRHEILRTTFTEVNGEAMQKVSSDFHVELPLIDLQDVSKDKRETIVKQLATEETLRPFDLTRGPLFRTTLIRLNEAEHIVLFTMHHIITDGWSMGVLNREIAVLYDAFVKGTTSPLPKLSLQYADYAQWQKKWLTGSVLDSRLAYWKKQLGDNPSVLELPTDYPRPAVQTYTGKDEVFKFSKDLTEKINKFSRENNATLFMTLLAAFQTLLARYSGQNNISVGTPIANRTRAEMESLIGFFVNTLVLRADLTGDPTFLEVLKRVREMTLGAYANQEVPFEKLVEVLQPERDMGHTPLFQVMFILQNTPMQPITLSKLTISPIQIESKTAEFDLTLSMNETTNGLSAALQYNSDLFESATINRMIQHFQNLLEAIVANPEERVSTSQLLSQAEIQEMLVEWNTTQTDLPEGKCVHHLIEEQADRTPNAIAVLSGERYLTFNDLNQRANKLARYLNNIGVRTETLVGICVERSLEMIVGLLGILKAGGAYVPLDPNYPEDRLDYIIKDAGVAVLITQKQLVSGLPKCDARIVCIDTDWEKIEQYNDSNVPNEITSKNLAYVIYTSGSTGKPKGVLIRHESVVNHNLDVIKKFRLHTDDRILQFATLNFDAAVEEIFPSLICGATLVLRQDGNLISGIELLQLIEHENLTVVDLPTAYWHEWVFDLSFSKRELPPSLRLVVVGGDKASPDRLASWQKIAGPNVSWINTYGPTETTVISTLCEPEMLDGEHRKLPALPIGQPIANTQIYLLDTKLQPVPIGVPGELCIGGVGLARGYLNRPDLTAEKFIPNPFATEPGDRLYKTGDLARYLPDGNIDFIGRADNQVKIRGFRVELNEIDAVLEQHPLIHEVVTIAEDIENRAGEKRIVAYCAPSLAKLLTDQDKRRNVRIQFLGEAAIDFKDNQPIKSEIVNLSGGGACLLATSPIVNNNQSQRATVALKLPTISEQIKIDSELVWQHGNRVGIAFRNMTPEHQKILDETILQAFVEQHGIVKQLRDLAQNSLPEYMAPAIFVMLNNIPKTPSGKVDRKALPKPDIARTDLGNAYIPPRNAMEELLAGIWSQLLGIDHISVYDSFFDLGGHSLLATRFISQVRDVFQVELPLKTIFEAPTIASLAEKINSVRDVAEINAPPIRPVPRVEIMPLSFGQQRLWFLDQLEPNSPLYNIPNGFQLQGKLDIDSLCRSINEIVRRHENLRTIFKTVDGKPALEIVPSLSVKLSLVDVTELPENDRERAVLDLATAEIKRPFRLDESPLFRTVVFRLNENYHIIVLTIHHIISDGWSSGVLIQEIAALYDSFSRGKLSPLPELKIQYADYAHWQRNWLQGEVLENQLNYWKQQLADSPALLELPTDFPRPAIQTTNGSHYIFELPKVLSDRLIQISRQEGATQFMTMLAAFQTLLYRYSGQDDICVGTPIANRNRGEIENLIGFFVNTLVLRTRLSSAITFKQLLSRVRETTLGAYTHQDLPFEKVVDAVQPERNMSHTPLFQVMFMLQNTEKRELSLEELSLSSLELDTGISTFDLTLSLAEGPDGFSGAFEYNTDLFKEATMAKMVEHFQMLLQQIAENPEAKVTDLSILTPAQEKTIIEEWNNTEALYATEYCIDQLFEAQVSRTPDAVAVIYEDQQLSYLELNQRANQLARALKNYGIQPDIPVGICIKRSLEMMVGLLGILKAGGCYLPLDPDYPEDRLAFMIEDSKVSVLLTQQKLVNALPKNGAKVICLDSDWEDIAQANSENLDDNSTPQRMAYLMYTSGSTGRPKGVMVEHQSVVNHNLSCIDQFGLKPGDRMLQFATINFDTAIEEIFPTLLSGATLVLRNADGVLATGADLMKLVEKYNLTVLDLPTAYWHEWVFEMTLEKMSIPDSLRLVIVGGDKTSAERFVAWRKMVGSKIQWLNTYGPTEGTIIATAFDPDDGKNMWQMGSEVPIGRPIANAKIHILDRQMQPVPVGVKGYLHIGGASVARGYLNRPDLTAENFVPDPFSQAPGVRLYNTGDLARYLPDGNIEFIGRADHQVKIRGFRIELSEIEAELEKHPLIQEAVVVAKEETPSSKRLVAYCVPVATREEGDLGKRRHVRVPFLSEASLDYNGNQTAQFKTEDLSEGGARLMTISPIPELDNYHQVQMAMKLPIEPKQIHLSSDLIWKNGERIGVAFQDMSETNKELIRTTIDRLLENKPMLMNELRNYLKERLPDYMVPATFMILEKLPRTPSNKIDRRALPEPDFTRIESDGKFILPRNETELKLAEIWSKVLRIEKISVNDNFFELGGDSILSIQVIAQANQAGLQLTPKQIFENPTIGGLAAVAGTGQAIQADQGIVIGDVVLTPIQRWFFQQDSPELHHYNQSVFFEVKQRLEPEILKQAIELLYQHHDALRLRYLRGEAGWQQSNADLENETPFSLIDFSAIAEQDRKAAIEKISASTQASLNLEQGPIMKVVLFDAGKVDSQRLLIVIHHLAVDGVSWRILLEDLQTIYGQLQQDRPAQLPPKTTSFQYWANKLAAYAQSSRLLEEMNYWSKLTHRRFAPLPIDMPDGENTELSGRTVAVSLSKQETDELLKEVPAVYHTQINDVLLTALAQAYYRMTGARQVIVELEGHGREDLFADVDLSRTVGWFTSVYPVLLDLKFSKSPGEAVKTIKEQIRQIPDNGIGFGLLRYLNEDREITDKLTEIPKAEICFNYLGQFDQVASDSPIFEIAKESKGSDHSPLGKRSHAIEINGSIAGGKLQLDWSYSENLHRRATIERLAQHFINELKAIIAHCTTKETGEFTPSDFTLVNLDQKKLDKVMKKLGKRAGLKKVTA